MTEIQKKIKSFKDHIAHFKQNEQKYIHGEFEGIEQLAKGLTEWIFNPDENTRIILEIQNNTEPYKKFLNTISEKEYEKFLNFFRFCKDIVKDEGLFYAFQAELTDITQIDDATIKELYEKIIGSFDSEKFLLCKRILKSIQQKNQPLVWQYYYDTEGELVEKAKIKNRTTAKEILIRFCSEINLDYRPCTKPELEEWKKQKAGYNIQIEETIENLKKFQETQGEELDKFKTDIDGFLSKIKDSNDYKEKAISKYANSTKSFYQEEEKINKLRENKEDLQKVKQKIENIRKSVLGIKKHIADKIDEVDTLVGGDKLSNITDNNVITILSKVSKEYESVSKKYHTENNTNIDEYHAQIKRFNVLIDQFNKLTDEIDRERKKTDGDIDTDIKTLKSDLLKQDKPLTSIFICLQVVLFVATCIYFAVAKNTFVIEGQQLFFLNAVLFVGYIIWVCLQFNKHNKIVEEIKDLSENETYYAKKKINWVIFLLLLPLYFFPALLYVGHINKSNKNPKPKSIDYYTQGKLIGSILLACLFFICLQFCFLLVHYGILG